MLLKKLYELGLKQRMARKVMRDNKPATVAQALARLSDRKDIENPAGYLIRELEDGGYEEVLRVEKAPPVSKQSGSSSDAPMVSVGVSQTKIEMERLDAERTQKELSYRQERKALLQRFEGLSVDLKLQLKERWTRHLKRIVPNTPKRDEALKNQQFQKLAFLEIAKQFFGFLDEGLAPEAALLGMAA